MSIFTQQTLTPAQKAAANVAQQALQAFNVTVSALNVGYHLIWNNNDATPMEVLQALGTDAQGILSVAEAQVALINTEAPGTITFTIPYTVTFNADGSINTITPV